MQTKLVVRYSGSHFGTCAANDVHLQTKTNYCDNKKMLKKTEHNWQTLMDAAAANRNS